jgi:hypothetical protein
MILREHLKVSDHIRIQKNGKSPASMKTQRLYRQIRKEGAQGPPKVEDEEDLG